MTHTYTHENTFKPTDLFYDCKYVCHIFSVFLTGEIHYERQPRDLHMSKPGTELNRGRPALIKTTSQQSF